MTQPEAPITFKALQGWVPIVLSIMAVFFAYTNQQQQLEIRLKVLEITVNQQHEARIEQLESTVDSLVRINNVPNTNPSNPN